MPERTLVEMEMARLVPVARVPLFEFLTDFRNERLFGATIRSCRLATRASPEREIGEGTEFWFEYEILWLVLATRFRLEDVVAGERFRIRSLTGGVPFAMDYALAEADGGTTVTVRTTLYDRWWMRALRPLIARAVERDMNAYMDALVAYLTSPRWGEVAREARG